MIPPRIILFWHDHTRVPLIVERCVANIRRLHPAPAWSVEVYDDRDLPAAPEVRSLAVQHRADWLRLQRLRSAGGIWMDISSVVFAPVDAWLDRSSDRVIGYEYPHSGQGLIENWFLAVPAGSAFLDAWCAEFDGAVREGLAHYCKRVLADPLAASPPHTLRLPYHTQHLCAWMVGQRMPAQRPVARPTARDVPSPLFHNVQHDWNQVRAMWFVMRSGPGALRRGCDHTFLKLCCGTWWSVEWCWRLGLLNTQGDVAQQLQLRTPVIRVVIWCALGALAAFTVLRYWLDPASSSFLLDPQKRDTVPASAEGKPSMITSVTGPQR